MNGKASKCIWYKMLYLHTAKKQNKNVNMTLKNANMSLKKQKRKYDPLKMQI